MEQHQKIAWITVFPHTLYESLFGSFAKQFKNPELAMVLADRYRNKGMVPDGTRVVYAPYSQPIRVTGLGYFKDMDAALRPLKPSAIIVNLYYSLPALQAFWFAKKEGVPLYISAEEDGYRNFWQRIIFPLWDIVIGRRILNRATAILCWSKGSCSFMERKVSDKEKIIYFPASIEGADIVPRPRSRRKRELRLLLPARLVSVKNHKLLLRAMRIVQATSNVPVLLTLLGDGPLRGAIEEDIKRYGLADVVRLHGEVSRDEVFAAYAEHDALVLPGRHETIGFVALEAMANGIPVLVSDTLGARDFIEDGISGFLFQSGSAEDLAEKIITLAASDTDAMGRAARKRVCEYFDIYKQLNLLRDVLAAGTRKG